MSIYSIGHGQKLYKQHEAVMWLCRNSTACHHFVLSREVVLFQRLFCMEWYYITVLLIVLC